MVFYCLLCRVNLYWMACWCGIFFARPRAHPRARGSRPIAKHTILRFGGVVLERRRPIATTPHPETAIVHVCLSTSNGANRRTQRGSWLGGLCNIDACHARCAPPAPPIPPNFFVSTTLYTRYVVVFFTRPRSRAALFSRQPAGWWPSTVLDHHLRTVS